MDDAISNAATRLGYSELKPEQAAVVKSFAEGRDVFACLPTGYGKSLCFAILPFLFDILRRTTGSIVLCVSPLTSLMLDQRSKFTPRGLSVEFIGEAQDDPRVLRCVEDGGVQLVYTSPECLLGNRRWRSMLCSDTYRAKLVAFVVDEAHCIKKWGDKFRVEFARLGEIRSLVPPTVNVMALTATATHSTRKSILKRLGMKHPYIVSVSPNKTNMIYEVREKNTMENDIVIPISQKLHTGDLKRDYKIIIFCRTYNECSQMYLLFKHHLRSSFTDPCGCPDLSRFRVVEMYSKCTEQGVKESIVLAFCNPNSCLRVVIATIAFGMGLDSPCVRSVIHWGPSQLIEDYVQESGRGGRDGNIACALLFYAKKDQQHSSKSMQEYCRNMSKCRRLQLFSEFEDTDKLSMPKSYCSCCDVCKKKCTCGKCYESNILETIGL